MKVDRHGRAKIFTSDEIQKLFNEGVDSTRDRTLLAIMLFTAARINEAVTLQTQDVYTRQGVVRPYLLIRKGNTKGKLATRTIPILEDLRGYLKAYSPHLDPVSPFLFPGKNPRKHLHPDYGALLVRRACNRVGIEGASSHSFRRTALTLLSDAGIPLRVIQEISGHRKLDQLQTYLEVKPEQVKGAIAALSTIAPVAEVEPSKSGKNARKSGQKIGK